MSTDHLETEEFQPRKPSPRAMDRSAAHAELRAAGFRAEYSQGVHSIFTADVRLFIESLSFAGAMQAFRANLHRIRRVA